MRRRPATAPHPTIRHRGRAPGARRALPLGAAHAGVSQVSNEEFVRLLVAASIRGLVAVIPPGRPIDEVVVELSDAGKDR